MREVANERKAHVLGAAPVALISMRLKKITKELDPLVGPPGANLQPDRCGGLT
jgi:hypothetical protein